MINIHFFGTLRRLCEKSRPTEDSIMYMEYIKDETISDLLIRVGINEEIGDVFINRQIAYTDSIIPSDNSRIAIFSRGMFLLDGGQYIKGHGFITKRAPLLEYPDQNY